MSGPRRLDDSLARMAKWEELRRRADATAARAAGAEPDARPGAAAGRAGHAVGAAAADPTGRPVPPSAVDDLIQTLHDLAARQPSLSVAVIAQESGVTWHLHTVRTDDQVQIVAARTEAHLHTVTPTQAPVSAPADDSAIPARLAEMLRTNPTMLDT
jgi:hypothetical protein